jgi:hypothetical protein
MALFSGMIRQIMDQISGLQSRSDLPSQWKNLNLMSKAQPSTMQQKTPSVDVMDASKVKTMKAGGSVMARGVKLARHKPTKLY